MTGPEGVFDIAGHVGGIFAGAVAMFFTAIQAREKWFSGNKTKIDADVAREEAENANRAELVKIKDDIIEALRVQNTDLKKQLDASLERERAWVAERREMKQQISTLEREYRALLRGVVEGDWCGIARGCGNRVVPGDRRELGTGTT